MKNAILVAALVLSAVACGEKKSEATTSADTVDAAVQMASDVTSVDASVDATLAVDVTAVDVSVDATPAG